MSLDDNQAKFYWIPREKVEAASQDYAEANTVHGAFWESKLDTEIKPYVAFTFKENCAARKKFTTQTFIINTTFCGDWAGGIYALGQGPGCVALVSNAEYGKKGQKDSKGRDLWDDDGIGTHFLFNSVKIFKKTGAADIDWKKAEPLKMP